MKKAATMIAATALLSVALNVHAQTRYELVHTFSGDRGRPTAALAQGLDGRLYGTTRFGGAHGKGSVFVTEGAGSFTVLHEFVGTDGEGPEGRLLAASDGYLYGTTSGSAAGFGTIFRLRPDGSAFEVVVDFNGANGLVPRSGLVLGADGAMYGTTSGGGDAGAGTVFRLTAAGDFTTLVHFDGVNGASPSGELIATADGLYGTTAEGGGGFGTVFHVAPDGALTTRVAFDGTAGIAPSGIVLASDGTLYGATSFGGDGGVGTVFRITASGLETLHSFAGPDGAQPAGALRELSDGNIYGTTSSGGATSSGTIFRVGPDGVVTSVVSFNIGDGSFPASGVIETAGGAIYGTTEAGGPGTYGTVFELAPGALIRTAVSFSGAPIADPVGGLIQASDGNFYGVALAGGTHGFGAVFRMTSDGSVTTLASFDSAEGLFPTGALMQAADGDLYGTTEGGPTGDGGVFRVTLGGTLTTIGLFDFFTTGAAPSGALTQGSDGHLYGTVLFGVNGAPGGVFRIDPTTGTISAVATLAADESQGALPAGGVIEGPDGSLYGSARMGGANGFGTIFRVTGGEVTTMASFNGDNGWDPASRLLLGADGNLYGTTAEGGANASGTLFRLALDGTLTTLVSFDGLNGWFPFQQGVIEVSDGVFAGATMFGGELALGTTYQWSSSGLVVTHAFDGVSGSLPNSTLLKASDGALYGTAFGPQGGGIFRLVADRVDVTLAVAPASAIYGGTTTLSATLTASGAPVAGAEIAFSLNGVPAGTALTDDAGVASVSNVSVAGLDAGTYPGAVQASHTGADAAAAVSASGDLVIAPATPAIAVQDASFVYDGLAHAATGTVTGIAGEPLGPLAFTYNGSPAAPIDPGSYAVVATFAGSNNYAAASATATLTISPAPAGANGLIAAYGFNEGSGSTAGDASGRGNAGRIKQARWAAGRFGRALDFDGVNDWVTIRDAAALDIRNAITIEAWVNPRSLSGWNTILLKEDDNGLAYSLYANNWLPQPAGYVNVGGEDRAVAGVEPVPLNTWTHLAMTYNGSTMRLFVNGVEVKRRALTGRIRSTDEAMRIGGNSIWGEFFDGLIDEVRLYGRALSVAEIRRDMTMPVAHEGIAPAVAITAPIDGAVLSGTPIVAAAASDNFMLSNVTLEANGEEVSRPATSAPFDFRLDLANGTYELRAIARDVAGNMAVSEPITVTIQNAPVASYDFDEASGSDVVDSSGRGNHGSMSGGVSRATDADRGRVLSFSGTDGFVTVADADSLDLTTGMTLEAWVRPTALGGWRTVILKEGNGLSYALYADDDVPGPSGYVRVAGTDRSLYGRKRLEIGTWTHIAMTYDGEMLRLFVQGEEVASRAQTGAAEISGGALRIGGNAVWGEWFRGQIDNVRIYDVAVGAAQIQADMRR